MDIHKFKEVIEETHSNFIKDNDFAIAKTHSDKYLMKTIVTEKILQIAHIFSMKGIVDLVEILDSNNNYSRVRMSKHGLDTTLDVFTDGQSIVIKDGGFYIVSELRASTKRIITIDDIDSFNFEQFGIELLDNIHVVIYNRKDVNDTKLEMMLGENNGV